MGSRLIGSFGYWDHFSKDLHVLFGINTKKCVSVNGIIRLMGSVCLGPKVIPLSGAHCSMKNSALGVVYLNENQFKENV
jgi:hypothetical protein